MKGFPCLQMSVLAVAAAGLLAAAPALADRPSWAGGEHEYEHGHGHKHEREDRERGRRFDRRGRDAVRAYYAEHYKHGRCPPGLARKHNGCMPPGHTPRRWAVGRTLPSTVTIYAVPSRLVVQMGAPPIGYRYVRVANDILMVAAGTNMVVDAITDLGR